MFYFYKEFFNDIILFEFYKVVKGVVLFLCLDFGRLSDLFKVKVSVGVNLVCIWLII